jgi:hypothetical protein
MNFNSVQHSKFDILDSIFFCLLGRDESRPYNYTLSLTTLPAFAESRQLQLADECGKGTSAGFAEAGALVPPTSVGGAPLFRDLEFVISRSVRDDKSMSRAE